MLVIGAVGLVCGLCNRRAGKQPVLMVCRVISCQRRGGSRQELFVNSLLFIGDVCVDFFLGGPLIVACAGLSSSLVLVVVFFSC